MGAGLCLPEQLCALAGEAGLSFCQAEPLGKPQVQHGELLPAAPGTVILRGGASQKAIQVAGPVEPPPAPEGVGRGAQPQIFMALPVEKVVAALIAWAGEVADLVLKIAQLGQLVHTKEILAGGLVLLGQVQSHAGKGGAGLHLQQVGGEMLWFQCGGKG